MATRVESDSIGRGEIPGDAYYGIQSARARNNFPITHLPLNAELIKSLVEVKKAAAIANLKAGGLSETISGAIVQACDDILAGNLLDEFIVDPIQGGAGTSANMNANEVIANRALEFLGLPKGRYDVIHPNDHVNMCQSTNDVYPTAGKLTAIKLLARAEQELRHLCEALEEKSEEFTGILKMGRTQLQDAVPISLGQSFGAFVSSLRRDIVRFQAAREELSLLNLGGTAIGTGVNASEGYFHWVVPILSRITGLRLRQADDLIDATQNLDCFVYVSGIVKACAVNLSKMSNDLRLLSSGPRTGLSEINLPAMQNGSSIMPGKVNPVIPEVVSQVAFGIIGNDTAITLAAEAGQLELNAFEPVLFYKLFESIETLGHAARTLADNCVAGITANAAVCREYLQKSVGTVTALCPHIGYVKAAELAKKSLRSGKSIQNIILEEHILSEDEIKILMSPAAMVSPLHR